MLHATRTDPLLRGFSSWAMGSNAIDQQIIEQIPPEALASDRLGAHVFKHRAAAAVEAGDYAQAAQLLTRMEAIFERVGKEAPRWATEFQIYLHVAAGDSGKAQAVFERTHGRMNREAARRELAAFYAWAQQNARAPTSTAR